MREFSPTPVSEDDVAKILEAGRLAPSAKNWQPWDFVLVTDRDQLRDLTGVWQGAWHVGGAAAAIAIVAPNPPDDRWAGMTASGWIGSEPAVLASRTEIINSLFSVCRSISVRSSSFASALIPIWRQC